MNPADVAPAPGHIVGDELPTYHNAIALAFAELWRVVQSGDGRDGRDGPVVGGSFAFTCVDGNQQ